MKNQILAALNAPDRDALQRTMQSVSLTPGMILEDAHQQIDHVYFPESGVASVVAFTGAGRKMEAGPFGWDGMSGLPVVLKAGTTPSQTVVQIAGAASRVPAAAISDLFDRSPIARQLFLKYSHTFALQAVHTALAAGLAPIEQRLARWLLMLHDRIEGDDLHLTHDFMAFMLAVRRPGVTVALHELEGKALIRSHRKVVRIRDREGLIELCAGIYGVPEAEYRRLILGTAGADANS